MLKGYQSWEFKKRPVIMGTATIVGPDEGNGPLGNEFDIVHADTKLGQDSWEKAEKKNAGRSCPACIGECGGDQGAYSILCRRRLVEPNHQQQFCRADDANSLSRYFRRLLYFDGGIGFGFHDRGFGLWLSSVNGNVQSQQYRGKAISLPYGIRLAEASHRPIYGYGSGLCGCGEPGQGTGRNRSYDRARH